MNFPKLFYIHGTNCSLTGKQFKTKKDSFIEAEQRFSCIVRCVLTQISDESVSVFTACNSGDKIARTAVPMNETQHAAAWVIRRTIW